ncbi:MAG: hypothetical protein PVJ39_10530 [Gammaproteobacteria bacterium]
MNLFKLCLKTVSVSIMIFLPFQSSIAGGLGFTQIVQWKGVGEQVTLPAHIGRDVVPAGITCYKVPMVMPQTGIRIGTGFDCITNPGSLPAVGEGTVTTYYIFAFQGRGTIISENRVVVRSALDSDELNPVPMGSPPANENFTHILGSFPSENTVVGGTRKFRKAEGKVRVSGGVSLADFPNTIVFDDLFVFDLQ